MVDTQQQLHLVFLPYMAGGHIIPLVDIARLFAAHDNNNIKVTIITTPMNALTFKPTIDRDLQLYNRHISLDTVPFPWMEAGLPQGIESDSDTKTPEMTVKFLYAIRLLRPNIEALIRQLRPHCIVSDILFPWTAHLAQDLGIPRLAFIPTFFLSLSVGQCIHHYQPQKNVESDTEPFVVPGLPNQLVLTKSQLFDVAKVANDELSKIFLELKGAEEMSFGTLINSFYELESGYADYYRNVMGIKAWHVGPVSLFCKHKNGKVEREEKDTASKDSCLSWLDSKKPRSVFYVCFGSQARFSRAQLTEIACALEKTGHFFIWVVRKVSRKEVDGDGETEWWLPEGFEERTNESGKGMVIKGWAPQVLILEHKAIGGCMTHAGSNSVLESVTAGVPMVTWPLWADQFVIEKLVTQVLKCGLPVGNLIWRGHPSHETALITREDIEEAVRKVMTSDDEDAQKMRKTARQLSELARKAVEDGGSSANDLKALIQEIRAYVKK